VCFAEKRFTNKTDRNSRCRRFDGRAQTSAASTDYQDIMLESFVIGHGFVEELNS